MKPPQYDQQEETPNPGPPAPVITATNVLKEARMAEELAIR